jgi:hypothetical protein
LTAQAQLIDFGEDDHTTVIGRTRSGKTTGALWSLQRSRRAVLFFNTQQIKFPKGWTRATMHTDADALIGALRDGEKVVYDPSREHRQGELRALIGLLYKAANEAALDIYLVVDEVHLFTKGALRACVEVATTGIRWGIKAIWISQRPANIDNTLMTQSTRFVVYDISNMEAPYLKKYQIPYDAIYAQLRAGGKYTYTIYDGHEITGPFMVQPI